MTEFKHGPQHLILCNCKSSLKQERGGLIMEQLLPQIMSYNQHEAVNLKHDKVGMGLNALSDQAMEATCLS